MKVFGKSSLYEFLGDRVVYRNLTPADSNLPALDDLRLAVGIAPGVIPRKSELPYAQVITGLLRTAQAHDSPEHPIQHLVYIGDTRMLDGTAFQNICASGGWPGIAFIGSEDDKPAQSDLLKINENQFMYLSNRWDALAAFDELCGTHFLITTGTAVIIDLDKTALGARGRNSQVIDQARVQAVFDTVSSLLVNAGQEKPGNFKQAYELLNQPDFHSFTADNQDYLAYICLVIGSGLVKLPQVVERVRSGDLSNFRDFIDGVNQRQSELPSGLQQVHREIYAAVLTGDPTPFKSFRRSEYLSTVSRFGQLPDDVSLDQMLNDEIVITQEVRQVALSWRERGALLFGLSDKPDEASVPTIEQADHGYRPLHRTETHVVGA
jgi:hypothetical protein